MTHREAMLSFTARKTLPMILQDERAACGHACIEMISHFWGHRLDRSTIQFHCKTSSRGSTLSDLNHMLEALGFLTRALKIPIEALASMPCPAILHWNMNHFVVLKEVKKNQVVIHDPATGVRHCSMEELAACFTGIALEVQRGSDFKIIRQGKSLTLSSLVRAAQGVKPCFIVLLLLSLTIEALSILNPLFMQYVTDNVIGSSERSNLLVISFGFLCVGGLQVVTEYMRGHLVIVMTNQLTEQFSSNVVKHILQLPLSFFEKRHVGDLQSKFQSIDQIQKKISTDFINTVLDGLLILITVLVMLCYSSLLTGMVLCALALTIVVRFISYQSLKRHTEHSIYEHANAMSVFLETLKGIVPIKSFLKEGVRFHTWRNSYIDALNADIQISKKQLIYQVAQQLLFYVEHIGVVTVGALLVISNQFSVGMLIAFLAYRLLLVNKSSSFVQNIFDYALISIQLRRLGDILFEEPETVNSGVGHGLTGALSLRQVYFRYHASEGPVLHNLTLEIKAGEKVAIVGRSGGGKSTLLKVMMGLLESSSGEILLDGIPLKQFGLNNYRSMTAAVMQDDALLSGSILDNISFFDEVIDIDRVYRVAALACIHEEIIQCPMGYETLVGDMGSTLSGGQKQRILIARALYKQPKILFLDEATSHLDLANEQAINRSLKSLAMTQIIIAHREETIRLADRIIHLDELVSS